MEEYRQSQAPVFDIESATTGQHRVTVTDVNDIIRIYFSVMIDVFILGITGITYIRSVLHDNGFSLQIIHHITFGIASIGIGRILVYALITETVERTYRNTGFESLGILTVLQREILLCNIRWQLDDFIYVAVDIEVG